MFTCRRPLFVHAHPDDETIFTGAWLAALIADGARPAVVTATRGEQGQVDGLAAGSSEHRAWRMREWARALEILGVDRRAWLGLSPARAGGLRERVYQDSGMRWLDASETVAGPGDTAGPLALSLADPSEIAADILAYARVVRADCLVTYDERGGYGHPDHVALHRPTLSAAALLGVPAFEILSAGAPSSLERVEREPEDVSFLEPVERVSGGVSFLELVERKSGEPGGQTQTITLADYKETLVAALECYASQVSVDGDDLVHVGGQRQPLALSITYRRV